MSPIKLESETNRNFRFSMSEALTRCGEGYGSIVVREGGLGYYKTLKSLAGDASGSRGRTGNELGGAERLRSLVAKGAPRG